MIEPPTKARFALFFCDDFPQRACGRDLREHLVVRGDRAIARIGAELAKAAQAKADAIETGSGARQPFLE